MLAVYPARLRARIKRSEGQVRVLMMGCGGIGGVVAANVIEHGYDVVAITHNAAITDAINSRGFQVRENERWRKVRARAWTAIPPDAGLFDFVFLATQPPQVTEAAQSAAPFLRASGAMLCFQNGLCEQYIAPLIGTDRTVGAIVAWGSSMTAPGVYDRTSGGGFVLGRLDGVVDDRFGPLAQLLGTIGPVEITRNLQGARWSKLAINCAISSLGTIGGRRLGRLIRYRFVRRLALEVMTEAVAVARRLKIHLEKISGTVDLEWLALTPADVDGPGSPSLMAKHALLLAVGAKFRRLRSSMLLAIERGREPAVDYLNGEVVRRGAALDVPVPINSRVQELIRDIWQRRRQPSPALLRQLFADSRSDARRMIRSPHRAPIDDDRRAAL